MQKEGKYYLDKEVNQYSSTSDNRASKKAQSKDNRSSEVMLHSHLLPQLLPSSREDASRSPTEQYLERGTEGGEESDTKKRVLLSVGLYLCCFSTVP